MTDTLAEALDQVGALTSQVNAMRADTAASRVVSAFSDQPEPEDTEIDETDPLGRLASMEKKRKQACAAEQLTALVAAAKGGEPEDGHEAEEPDGFQETDGA